MGRSSSVRLAGLMAAAAILTGCDSQTGGAMPQGAGKMAMAHRAGSWMKAGASKSDLIYVSFLRGQSSVYVYSYPSGSHVGTLTGFIDAQGVCSDAKGNVWITDAWNGYLYQYAHGATSPTTVLQDTEGSPKDCSVEPSTGDLAVGGVRHSIAVYPRGSGAPTYYSTEGFLGTISFISYDGSGNLYVAMYRRKPAWLPKGGSVGYFKIKPKAPHGGFRWDGQHFTVGINGTIDQYEPSGGHSGQPVGSVSLNGINLKDLFYSIQGGIIAVAVPYGNVYVYNYPQGGNPTLTIPNGNSLSAAVSVAPSRSRTLH